MGQTFSVIVPALGEGALIDSLVDRVRAVAHGRPVEILVVDGHPGRTTLAALTRPGVTGLHAPQGRARQMNAGARAAHGDVLVFLHADSELPDHAFEAMEAVLTDGSRVGGAFDLGIGSPSRPLALIALAATLRSRLTRIPYGDQAIFLLRKTFETLNGFADIPILEDVDLMLRLRRANFAIGFAKGRCLTSARRWGAEGIWRRTLLNQAIMLLYFLGMPPRRLSGLHKPHAAAKAS